MSSGRGSEKPNRVGAASVNAAIVVEGSSSGVTQLGRGVADVSLNAGKNDGWEVYAGKSKKKPGYNNGKQAVTQITSTKAWDNPGTVQKLGMRSNAGSGKGPSNSWPTPPTESKRPAGRGYAKPQSPYPGYHKNGPASSPAIGTPLRNGWDWSARVVSTQTLEKIEDVKVNEVDDDVDDDSDVLDNTDDELLSGDYDSDASGKSHETRKKNSWFKEFFESLDKLTVEQINDPERKRHCPACKGVPGVIQWYYGLQPLITHAKTKGSKRMKLHRKLAELLEEELRRRGTSLIPAGEVFDMWKILDVREKEIVWPPMVIIMNTQLEKDEYDKWKGMGNQELLLYLTLVMPPTLMMLKRLAIPMVHMDTVV